MSWKKNKFSYFMWFLYTLFTVAVLMIATEAQADKIFGKIPFGGVIPGFVIAVLIGVAVYLRQWFKERKSSSRSKSWVVWEIMAAAVFFAVGFILRFDRIPNVQGDFSAYYEAAKVTESQVIPAVLHGAEFLYLEVLHLLFLFVGNKFIAAVWLQIVLQFLAALVLFVGVRRLAGPTVSLVMLGFFMLSGPMIDEAVRLSPQMLYLVLLAIGINFLATCAKSNLNLLAFLLAGIWVGLMGYLDIGGFLLLIILALCVAGDRVEKEKRSKKTVALCLGILGTLAGFFGAIGADAFISGKAFGRVLNAWLGLYTPGKFQSSVVLEYMSTGWWNFVLALFLTAGIYGFWYEKEKEQMSMWVLGGCVTAAAGCFGMFTEELPMYLYLFLFLAILAGLGAGGDYRVSAETEIGDIDVQEEAQIMKKEKSEKKEKSKKKGKKAALGQMQEVEVSMDGASEALASSVKLPKYLRDAGTGQLKIPAYMIPEEKPKVPESVETIPGKEPDKPQFVETTPKEEPALAPIAEATPEEPAVMPVAETMPEEEPAVMPAVETTPEEKTFVAPIAEEPSEKPVSSFRRLGETPLPMTAPAGIPDADEQDDNEPAAPVKEIESVAEPAAPAEESESVLESAAPAEENENVLESAAPVEEDERVDEPAGEPKSPKYIENPLPLPKPHVKRIMDYARKPDPGEDDFDHPVSDDDDFDI